MWTQWKPPIKPHLASAFLHSNETFHAIFPQLIAASVKTLPELWQWALTPQREHWPRSNHMPVATKTLWKSIHCHYLIVRRHPKGTRLASNSPCAALCSSPELAEVQEVWSFLGNHTALHAGKCLKFTHQRRQKQTESTQLNYQRRTTLHKEVSFRGKVIWHL